MIGAAHPTSIVTGVRCRYPRSYTLDPASRSVLVIALAHPLLWYAVLTGVPYYSQPPVAFADRFHEGTVLGIRLPYLSAPYSVPYIVDGAFSERTIGLTLTTGQITLFKANRTGVRGDPRCRSNNIPAHLR